MAKRMLTGTCGVSGYMMIARNFTVPGVKGEIDLIGYDGAVLAFVEVKTRTSASAALRLARGRGKLRQAPQSFAHGRANSWPSGGSAKFLTASTWWPLSRRRIRVPPYACIKVHLLN